MYCATEGNVAAQFNLGVRLDNAVGVPRNVTEAAHWYSVAAANGHTAGAYNLGCCYDSGTGVEQNYRHAVKWYRMAAKAGHAGAQSNLGWCYENSAGVKRGDLNKARRLYEASARQGHPQGQFNLANCWLRGLGGAQNTSEAVSWFAQSAAAGCAEAEELLGRLQMHQDPAETEAAAAAETEATRGDTDTSDPHSRAHALRQGIAPAPAQCASSVAPQTEAGSRTEGLVVLSLESSHRRKVESAGTDDISLG